MMSLIGKRQIATLFLLVLITVAQSYDCPEDCHCIVIKGVHPQNHAKCSSIDGLLDGKSLPIHSIDLSHAGISKIANHLEKLRDLTSIDLSNNQLAELGRLGRRVKSLNLKHNKITSGKLNKIPSHIQDLDLSHNEITYLPKELTQLSKLRTIELAGNKINCSCETLDVRNWLQEQRVYSDNHVKCAYPAVVKGKPWLQVKQTEICEHERIAREVSPDEENELMMGDQPADDEAGDELGEEHFLPVAEKKEDGHEEEGVEAEVEGSGDAAVPSLPLKVTEVQATEEEEEDGSGSGAGPLIDPRLSTDPSDDEENRSEDPEMQERLSSAAEDDSELGPSLGIANFETTTTVAPQKEVEEVMIVPVKATETLVAAAGEAEKETKVEAHGEKAAEIVVGQSENVDKAKTGDDRSTYILLGVLVILIVGLVIFVAVKRAKARRATHEFDPERATELSDMDKANLGKPLATNGHHENAPLIGDKATKAEITKPMNGNKRVPYDDERDGQTQEPLLDEEEAAEKPAQTESNNNEPAQTRESPIAVPRHTLDSLDAPHRIVPRYPPPKSPRASKPNGVADDDSFYASSPRSARYSPVYSPETGRVKIKLTETPKPKTPMLVTRSKSNAGEIITTPVANSYSEANNNHVVE